jgi:hypothetical protein
VRGGDVDIELAPAAGGLGVRAMVPIMGICLPIRSGPAA